MRAGFFPGGAKRIQEQLRTLGSGQSMALVSKTEAGDDSISTYEGAFGIRTMYYKVALALDARASQFQFKQK